MSKKPNTSKVALKKPTKKKSNVLTVISEKKPKRIKKNSSSKKINNLFSSCQTPIANTPLAKKSGPLGYNEIG